VFATRSIKGPATTYAWTIKPRTASAHRMRRAGSRSIESPFWAVMSAFTTAIVLSASIASAIVRVAMGGQRVNSVEFVCALISPLLSILRAPGGADLDSRRESSNFTEFKLIRRQISRVLRATARCFRMSRGRPIVSSISNSVTGVITSMRY